MTAPRGVTCAGRRNAVDGRRCKRNNRNQRRRGDLLGKVLKGVATKESAIKPEICRKTGLLMLEPTYKYLLLEDVGKIGKADL